MLVSIIKSYVVVKHKWDWMEMLSARRWLAAEMDKLVLDESLEHILFDVEFW